MFFLFLKTCSLVDVLRYHLGFFLVGLQNFFLWLNRKFLLPMSVSNNDTKVRIFGEFAKFLSDFFHSKSNYFQDQVTHLPTYPLRTFVF